jgi:hypothetical protein
MTLAASLAGSSPVPLVIDADALQPEIVHAGNGARGSHAARGRVCPDWWRRRCAQFAEQRNGCWC